MEMQFTSSELYFDAIRFLALGSLTAGVYYKDTDNEKYRMIGEMIDLMILSANVHEVTLDSVRELLEFIKQLNNPSNIMETILRAEKYLEIIEQMKCES